MIFAGAWQGKLLPVEKTAWHPPRVCAAWKPQRATPSLRLVFPRKEFGGDGITNGTAINAGNLTSGIALITWLPGRKLLP
jgi:hypothetical protein